MKCPGCGNDSLDVIDTRETRDGLRRRRMCKACGYRVSTIEIPKNAAKNVFIARSECMKIIKEAFDKVKGERQNGEGEGND